MATYDTDVATADVDDRSSADSFGNNSTRNTQRRTPGGFDPSLDGGVNAAQQARVSGAAAMDEAARGNFDTAKEYAKDAAGRAKQQGRAMLDEQKESAAGTVDSAANAFRNTAQQLQGEGRTEAGRYVEMFANELQALGHKLHNKNLDALVHDVEDFGRRSPGALLAGSVIAGFVLTRFLKSSAEHSYDRDRSQRREQSSYADDRSSSAYRSSPREDDGALLRSRPYAGGGSATQTNAGDIATDADMSGSVMEGSDVGTMAGVATARSPIATANESLIKGERYDNR